MFDTVVLISVDFGSQDSIGVYSAPQEARHEVYCQQGEITRSEWNTAGQAGYRAEMMLKLDAADYDGELYAEIGQKRYDIYRTYSTDDGFGVELYLGTKVGVSL